MAHRFLHYLLYFFFSAAVLPVLFSNLAFAGKRPLAFIENKGQVTDQEGNRRSDIDFKFPAANGLNLFIGNGQLHYQWVKARTNNSIAAIHGLAAGYAVPKLSPANTEIYRMDVQLIGADPNAVLEVESPTAYVERYYLPFAGDSGATAHTYQQITYHDIYPHIDWVFYFNTDGKLEHDFIVHPGGKVADIKLKYAGTSSMQIKSDGSLLAITPMGSVSENAPFTYEAGTKLPVPSSFVLNDHTLSFSTAASNGTLIIDPIVDWGTYLGGTDADMAYDNVIGKDGNIYITGATSSAANVATTGAYQFSYAGGAAYLNDAFMSKFRPDGTCLWSTYYGTPSEDAAKSISADTNGNLYIAGYTQSVSGLSSPGAQQAAGNGGYDGFVAKFDTAGQRIWGTYFGGEGDDGGYGPIALHCDAFNHIYLTGQTNSATGIAGSGAFQPALYGGAGDQDAFLAKYNSAGILQWSTYVGGNFGDAAYAVTSDTSGNIYIAGNTNSTTGIATVGQTTNGGSYDGFVAKFNAAGSKIWGTYVGGNLDEYTLGITCDNAVNIYLTGLTTSTSGLATSGAHQATYGGGYQDAMLAKLGNNGTIQWTTYYGGSSEDQGDKVIVGQNGDLYLSGFSGSDTGIVSGSVYQPVLGGAYDGIVARFNNVGTLIWGSYLGGVDADEAFSIAADTYNLYVAGNTMSSTGIAAGNSWQPLYGGGDYDGFLMRIKDCTAPFKPDSISGPTSVCAGSVNTYTASSTNAASYNWILPGGWIGSSSSGTITVTNDGNSGTVRLVALNDCSSSDTVNLTVTVNALPAIPQIVQSGNTLAVNGSYSTYQWNKDGQAITGATAATYSITASGNYTVTVSNAAGCSTTSDPVNLNVTAIDNLLSQNGITVFPNPASNVVFINSPVAGSAKLFNIQGQQLQIKLLKNGLNSISLAICNPGIYILRLKDKNGADLGFQKLIKE